MKDLAEFLLQTFPTAQYASGKSEIVMKCPFCGDSKDPKAKHFYISITEGKPHFYNCFKCGEKGILNSKVLRKLSVYNVEASMELDKYHAGLKKDPSNIIYRSNKTYNVYNRYIEDCPLSAAKLGYINNRLGLNLTYQDCLNLKIVLNLYDLLKANNINYITRNQDIVNELNNSFVGFLSMDNSFVNLRNLREGKVHKNIDHKYIEYNIFNRTDISKRNYVIPTTVDMLKPIEIHIAEGAFDILSIFFNVNNGKTYQSIYSSMGGKTYLSQIKMFLIEYGIVNATFHLYVDNDIEDYTLFNIKKVTTPLKIPIYIHRNRYTGENDFGVKRDHITDRVYLL